MKRLLLLVMVLGVAIFTLGCPAKNKTEPPKPRPVVEPIPKPPPQVDPIPKPPVVDKEKGSASTGVPKPEPPKGEPANLESGKSEPPKIPPPPVGPSKTEPPKEGPKSK
jgi:hypothetical protein